MKQNTENKNRYTQFKKVLKTVHIDNDSNFDMNLQKFLRENPDIKILHTIVHKPYHVSFIYEVSVIIYNG